MNTKNTLILLIFLLSVLGLIIGVYYTESADAEKTLKDSEDKVFEDPNGTIIITLEKNDSFLDGFFT